MTAQPCRYCGVIVADPVGWNIQLTGGRFIIVCDECCKALADRGWTR